ncbi:MAG: hypothetical protein OXJ52_05675 [Oligoflexia bacterium]|nr:hypothetical protein [Oligoflexia bacterium]
MKTQYDLFRLFPEDGTPVNIQSFPHKHVLVETGTGIFRKNLK